jgi:hypothetical protein
MHYLVHVAVLLSFVGFVVASYENYVLLESFIIVPKEDHCFIQLTPVQGQVVTAAKVSHRDASFLDSLPALGRIYRMNAKAVYSSGKYKLYTPNASLVGLIISEKKREVKVKLLARVMPPMTIEYFIFKEKVSLISSYFDVPYFSHRNWSIIFRRNFLSAEDQQLMREPNTVYYKVYPDIPITASTALLLSEHSFVAFPLSDSQRFVTMTIDYKEYSKSLLYTHYPSCSVTLLVVDKTPVSSLIQTKYSTIDDFAYYMTDRFSLFTMILCYILAYKFPLWFTKKSMRLKNKIASYSNNSKEKKKSEDELSFVQSFDWVLSYYSYLVMIIGPVYCLDYFRSQEGGRSKPLNAN